MSSSRVCGTIVRAMPITATPKRKEAIETIGFFSSCSMCGKKSLAPRYKKRPAAIAKR